MDKAVKNGYYPFGIQNIHGKWFVGEMDTPSAFDVIYSHDFARAFFGEDWYTEESPEQSNQGYYSSSFDTDDVIFQGMPWTYHLQQMVVSEDPIKYLESYLQ